MTFRKWDIRISQFFFPREHIYNLIRICKIYLQLIFSFQLLYSYNKAELTKFARDSWQAMAHFNIIFLWSIGKMAFWLPAAFLQNFEISTDFCFISCIFCGFELKGYIKFFYCSTLLNFGIKLCFKFLIKFF